MTKISCPIVLTKDFIPAGKNNRPGGVMAAKYITIHDTDNSSVGANAKAHAAYLKGNTAANLPVSWHFTVDGDGCVQHLPLTEHGWHAGDGHGPGNMSSVAMEICENADGDRAKTEENAAKLTAWLLIVLELDLPSVVPHRYWSGKNCPHLLLRRWDDWLEEVARYNADYSASYNSPSVWNPDTEIDFIRRDGLIDSAHKSSDHLTWGEFATVLNRLRRVRQ